MEGFEGAHAGIDSGGLGMDAGIPTFVEGGGSWVEGVVSLVVEGNCLETVLGFLDVGARSDFIISEKDGPSGLSLGVCILWALPLLLRNDLDRMSLAVCSGLKPVCIK